MKLIIPHRGGVGRVVNDKVAAESQDTHRVYEVDVTDVNRFGTHYRDPWDGTWFVARNGESFCTVGAMDRWS